VEVVSVKMTTSIFCFQTRERISFLCSIMIRSRRVAGNSFVSTYACNFTTYGCKSIIQFYTGFWFLHTAYSMKICLGGRKSRAVALASSKSIDSESTMIESPTLTFTVGLKLDPDDELRGGFGWRGSDSG